jgi:hypothetical protein
MEYPAILFVLYLPRPALGIHLGVKRLYLIREPITKNPCLPTTFAIAN